MTYDFALAGEPHRLGDYAVGEVIDHIDGVTIEEAEHMLATRLLQSTAKVHFYATNRADGKRLIYGGHVILLARALSFNGLANAQMIVALNSGAHANPCFAGDTVRAWTEVLVPCVCGWLRPKAKLVICAAMTENIYRTFCWIWIIGR